MNRRESLRLFLAATIILLFRVATSSLSAEASHSFADGRSHIVTTTISEPVLISNSTDVQVQGAALLLSTTGNIAAEVLDDSQLRLLSGNIWGTTSGPQNGIGAILHDNAHLNASGGQISGTTSGPGDGIGLHLQNYSQLDLSGGEVRGTTSGPGDAIGIVLDGSSRALIEGGLIRGTTSEPGMAYGAIVRGSSTLQMSGGTLLAITNSPETFGIAGYDNAKVEISGGKIFGTGFGAGYDLAAKGASQFTIVGDNFNYPVHAPITDLTGVITGSLASGQSFSFRFTRAATASIVLVPEPQAACICT